MAFRVKGIVGAPIKKLILEAFIAAAIISSAFVIFGRLNAGIESFLSALKEDSNIRSATITLSHGNDPDVDLGLLEKSEYAAFSSIFRESHTPWKKEKKLYDYTIRITLIINTGESANMVCFIDADNNIANCAIYNKSGEIHFWANDDKKVFAKMIEKSRGY